MKGWTPDGHQVTLSPWQERMVRALLDRRHARVITIRGRQWGWSTVLETARRYDANPLVAGPPDWLADFGSDAIGPPPDELPAVKEHP